MTSYTITVAPNDDSDRYTTLVLDTTAGQVNITDVHLHAGGGMTGGQIPAVDFGLLLQAINLTPGTPALTAPEPAPAPAPAAINVEAATEDIAAANPPASVHQPAAAAQAEQDTRQHAIPAVPAPIAEDTATSPAAAKSTRARKAGPAKNTARVNKTAADKAPAKKTAAKKAPTKATGNADGDRERVYRRMPEDFASVYQQAGTVAGVADHYNVPRYTVNGWLRRHRATTTG
jgi:hypothetical protein